MNELIIDELKAPWNKNKLLGQKLPLKLEQIWAIRIRLEMTKKIRELAMFNLALDSKLRACDLLKLKVRDVANGDRIQARAMVIQQKTKQAVQFEITKKTQGALTDWIAHAGLKADDYLFKSRLSNSLHLSVRQYARIVDSWVQSIGLDIGLYGTHSMRRTKASLIYKRTKNLRAIQLLLGHTKIDYLPFKTMSRHTHPGRLTLAGGALRGT